MLLARDVDFNARNTSGQTPEKDVSGHHDFDFFHQGHADVVEMLRVALLAQCILKQRPRVELATGIRPKAPSFWCHHRALVRGLLQSPKGRLFLSSEVPL